MIAIPCRLGWFWPREGADALTPVKSVRRAPMPESDCWRGIVGTALIFPRFSSGLVLVSGRHMLRWLRKPAVRSGQAAADRTDASLDMFAHLIAQIDAADIARNPPPAPDVPVAQRAIRG